MAATANPDAITHAEFKSAMQRVDSRLGALESRASRGQLEADRARVSSETEFVTRDEFRLFKWVASIALAAVLGGIGFLYQQQQSMQQSFQDSFQQVFQQMADMRIEMRDLHASLRQEMHAEIAAVRAEQVSIREEIASLRERVVRIETLLVGTEGDSRS